MRGYKLFTERKDGTIGPLFINRRQRIPLGEWLPAEDHPTRGYAHRPYWHATLKPEAPHLSERGRAWYEIEMDDVTTYDRPESQGGSWCLAGAIRVLGRVSEVQSV